MGLHDKRSVIRTGNSRAVTLPAKLKMGSTASLAANRLILVDPRGEIDSAALLEFLEEYIEPHFWSWYIQKREQNVKEDSEENDKQG